MNRRGMAAGPAPPRRSLKSTSTLRALRLTMDGSTAHRAWPGRKQAAAASGPWTSSPSHGSCGCWRPRPRPECDAAALLTALSWCPKALPVTCGHAEITSPLRNYLSHGDTKMERWLSSALGSRTGGAKRHRAQAHIPASACVRCGSSPLASSSASNSPSSCWHPPSCSVARRRRTLSPARRCGGGTPARSPPRARSLVRRWRWVRNTESGEVTRSARGAR